MFLEHQIRASRVLLRDRHSYFTKVILPGWRIKIEDSQFFDVHCLYIMSSTTSLRLTSLNVIMSLNVTVMSQYCHPYMADVSNRSDCIIKNPVSEMKGMQEKESLMGVRGR